MTYREAVLTGIETLTRAGVAEPDCDARELLMAAAGIDAASYALRLTKEIPPDTLSLYDSYLTRRKEREPLQRILGYAWFMGERYFLNEATLIPRYDSETLVLEAARAAGELTGPRSVLDVGTGSGCLLIALLGLCPDLTGTGVDLSERAVEAAERNAREAGVIARFLRSDLFSNVTDSYDIIISNPPYIPSPDIPSLEAEVREHDPAAALDGGADGLAVFRRLIAEAPRHLNEGGYLLVEIGFDQAKSVSALMREAGLSRIRVRADLAGRDRVVSGRMESLCSKR